MQFEVGQIYHVYNRGNNRQKIFFKEENYLFFLRKVRKLLVPNCEILAYCLMPNHFHFLIYAKEKTVSVDDKGRNLFSEAIRKCFNKIQKQKKCKQNRATSIVARRRPHAMTYMARLSKIQQ